MISGEVRDATTKQPLPMANVFVVGTNLGAASNENGQFVVRDVPSGNYEIRSSYVGYKSATYTDIVVSQSRTTTVSVELMSSQIEMNEVTVTGGYFERPAKQETKILINDKIEVHGSRITYEEKPALCAAEVKKSAGMLKLRSKDGTPLWSEKEMRTK